MINTFTSFFNSGIVTIVLLLIIFSVIALLASWLRKILMPTKDEGKVDSKKAVQEELARVLVPLEAPLTPKATRKPVPTKKASPNKKASTRKPSRTKKTTRSTNARKRPKAS